MAPLLLRLAEGTMTSRTVLAHIRLRDGQRVTRRELTQQEAMTLPAVTSGAPAHQNNVRLVVVDDSQQPAYLKRAAQLEKAMLTAAARLGVEAEDMPALRGLCIEAVRAAEVHQR